MHASPYVATAALAVFFIAHGSAAEVKEFGYPPTIELEEVRGWIDRAPTGHPRLLATRAELAALRSSLDADPLRRAVADAVIRQAELLDDVAPVTRHAGGAAFAGRVADVRPTRPDAGHGLSPDGRRPVRPALRAGDAGRGPVQRLEPQPFPRRGGNDLRPGHRLRLALRSAWPKPAARRSATAIVDKGVRLPWDDAAQGLGQGRNNWGQVCHGGLTAGALAVLEHEPDLAARTVHNALHNVTCSMAAYAPAGSYPEGPGYWAYGTSYNVLLIGVLESVLGTDFGLTKRPASTRRGQYPSLASGPSGLFFNYADGGAGRSPEPSCSGSRSRFHRPDWLLGERDRLAAVPGGNRPRMAPPGTAIGSCRWRCCGCARHRDRPKIRLPLHWQSRGETPITIHRSSWTDPPATFVGFKGGSPSASHGQMDVGSFVLDCDGVRWAVDLGAEGYHGIESRGMNLWGQSQDSDRWTIFRQSNQGHNTLVIDGQLQRASGRGRSSTSPDDARLPALGGRLDFRLCGPGRVGPPRRGPAAQPRGLDPGPADGPETGQSRPLGHDHAGPPEDRRRPDDRAACSRTRGSPCSILSPPAARGRPSTRPAPARVGFAQPGDPHGRLRSAAPATGELTLAVLATPGSCTESRQGRLEIRPLESWSR